ncbi:hypothetical protein Pint_07370 [Pistacia integerrima]|uniref:Uncharacterized protein n=1 Tax=Pistacia integerrima TaxID=434235 RepID=A0ACC0XY90_9ROSI|nr:hypothetical protein Pint_07370 [Pistacia integerrima]
MCSFLPPFIKPESLQHYIHVMDSMAREHFGKEWFSKNDVKVFPLSKKYTFALACLLFINVTDPEHAAKLGEPFALATAGLVSVPIDLPGTSFNRAVKAGNKIREELTSIILKRKFEIEEKKITTTQIPTEEFSKVTHLNLSIQSVIEQMEILKSKEQGELLNWNDLKKMKYSWCVACEAMRLAPPANGFFKESIIDFNYAGYTIPKGWKKFDPSRFEESGLAPYTFVPFGGGPRMCPGKEFADQKYLFSCIIEPSKTHVTMINSSNFIGSANKGEENRTMETEVEVSRGAVNQMNSTLKVITSTAKGSNFDISSLNPDMNLVNEVFRGVANLMNSTPNFANFSLNPDMNLVVE